MSAMILALSLGLASQVKQQDWERVTIKMVISTDTMVVATVQDPDLLVTLLGVGTPETIDQNKDKFLVGKSDPRWLSAWLTPGTPAWMERRGESVLGRPLVFLYRIEDKLCWNAYLVRIGTAYAFAQVEFREHSKMASLEAEAKVRGLGIWQGYVSTRPPEPFIAPARTSFAEQYNERNHSDEYLSQMTRAAAKRSAARKERATRLARSYRERDEQRLAQISRVQMNQSMLSIGSSPFSGFGSSLCGAPTKTTGAPCRNRVRGSGPCHLHR